MRLPMKSMLALIGFAGAVAQAANAQSVGSTSIRDGWVTVVPPGFQSAINNPLKGFRDYRTPMPSGRSTPTRRSTSPPSPNW